MTEKTQRKIDTLTAQFRAVLMELADPPPNHVCKCVNKHKVKEAAVHKAIQETILSSATEWRGRASDLIKIIDPHLATNGRPLIGSDAWLGRTLSGLTAQYPDQYRTIRINGLIVWVIRSA